MNLDKIAEKFVCETRPPSVLIIEDDHQIQRVLEMAFKPLANEITVAQDFGMVMVECDKPDRYDLVVLDLVIPGCGRQDLLRHVATHTNCPVMVYSGNIDEQVMHAAISILDRPIYFIEKPAMFTRERVQRIFRMCNMAGTKERHG